MWLAHALTLSRVPLAVALWWSYGSPLWSAAIVSLAALTDAADGTVARWSRRRRGEPIDAPSPGDWLDPLVDKLFVAIALAVLIAHDRDRAPWLLVLAAREVLLVPFAIAWALAPSLRSRLGHLRAAPIGKAATIAQLVAIATITIDPQLTPPLAIASGVLGVAAVAERIARAITSQ